MLSWTRRTRRAPLGWVVAALSAWPAAEARAGAADGFAVAGLGVGAVGIVDVGFLAYDVLELQDDNEPAEGAMIAQTAVYAPQMVLTNALLVLGQTDTENGAVFTLVGLVPAAFSAGMTSFGAWSLANHEVPVAPRLGVSFLVGANLALTTGAFTSAFTESHVATPFLAFPELVLGTAQAVPAFVQAARDPAFRGAWIGLGAWSTAIAAHGAVSVGAWATAPAKPKDSAPLAARRSTFHWMVAPTAVTDGAVASPGVQLFGAF
ncbi:MAG: hypothetical protein U0414_07865 [Polyangiaceae bacterium]